MNEGIDACVNHTLDQNQWSSDKRTPGIMTVLLTYGTHAKPFLTELERIADFCEKEERDFRAPWLGRKANSIREMIRANKNVADRPQLTSIQELPKQQE